MWRILGLMLVGLIGSGGGIFVPAKSTKSPKCSYSKSYSMMGFDCTLLNLVEVPQELNPNVQVLYLAVNRIRELHNNSFINYPYIRYLYLEDNSIAFIDVGAFEPLSELEVLDLSLNSLHAVPDALHSLPVLKKLSMAKNHFASVMFMDPLPSVEELDLSSCKLRDLPILEALPRLLKLNVSSNRIKSLNIQQLAPLCRLLELDMRGNKNLFAKADSFCECTLLVQWSYIRNIRTIPKTDTICRRATEALAPRSIVDNTTCFNNETESIFQESSLVVRSCEAGVLEYGSGPIRLRSSVWWTIGVFAACAILLVCFGSVYCFRRNRGTHRRSSLTDVSISIKARS